MILQGHGTTNDGNIARKFFSIKSHQICRKHWNRFRLNSTFGNILSVLASGYEINTNAFKAYGVETAKLFVSLYSWYYLLYLQVFIRY